MVAESVEEMIVRKKFYLWFVKLSPKPSLRAMASVNLPTSYPSNSITAASHSSLAVLSWALRSI
jgi:hypothetical protein